MTSKSIYRIIFVFGAESLLDNDASRHDLFKRKPLANQDIEQKGLCHAIYGSEFLATICHLHTVLGFSGKPSKFRIFLQMNVGSSKYSGPVLLNFHGSSNSFTLTRYLGIEI